VAFTLFFIQISVEFNQDRYNMVTFRPLIGCTTYRKRVSQKRPIDIYGLMPSYTEAITAAGGIPLLIPLGLSDEDLKSIFERLDGIVLPGGGDVSPDVYNGRKNVKMDGIDRERDQVELFMARAAVEEQKPFLAICRGIQVLNVALGGTLWEDVMSLVPGAMNHDSPDSVPRNHLAHTISIDAGTSIARIMGTTNSWVNSIHHQAIRDVAPDLEVTALAPDGIIEAAEVTNHPFAIGVQWHPENLIWDDPTMLKLFSGLVETAARQPSKV